MAQSDNLSTLYAQQMKHHPYGYALYKPVAESVIQRGSVGYFDGSGDWNPIAQLSDAADLENKGYKPLREPLVSSPKEEHTHWGPKTSQGVRNRNIGLDAGASFVIFAASYMKFSADHLAVLLATSTASFPSEFRQYISTAQTQTLALS
jgi:hypothetical protein